jgi:flavin-dependent dehydrogenase
MREYDVIVSGAGPAGCCVAIGLRRHGYSVALLERRKFPRAHIGEVLSPGVRVTLDFLGVSHVLDRVPRVESAGTLRKWDDPRHVHEVPAAGTFITDRGIFDDELRRTAQAYGAHAFRCGATPPTYDGAIWRVDANGTPNGENERLAARLWIDARGRQRAVERSYVLTTPPAVAIWEEYAPPQQPPLRATSRIEALPDGWLWATLTTTGRYRVLGVTGPRTSRTEDARAPKIWLHSALARSTLMREFAGLRGFGPRGGCAAGAYVDRDPWLRAGMKVGDAAFAMDPLSAGGVEKAMRHALQCTVAGHTLLNGGERASDVARQYYLDKLAESVANHAVWTTRHYEDAWPTDEPFWRDRRKPINADNERYASALEERIAKRVASVKPDSVPRQKFESLSDLILSEILQPPVGILSPLVSIVDAICVVNGKAKLTRALRHPALPGPVAFLQDTELVPLVADLNQPTSLNAVVSRWCSFLPRRRAMQVMAWLLRYRLVVAHYERPASSQESARQRPDCSICAAPQDICQEDRRAPSRPGVAGPECPSNNIVCADRWLNE